MESYIHFLLYVEKMLYERIYDLNIGWMDIKCVNKFSGRIEWFIYVIIQGFYESILERFIPLSKV